jgi:CheY-like chemotaxis protein
MDGLELIKKIKSKYHADVMIMTGYSAEYSFEEAVNAGASDFIFKPFKFEELELRICRVLRESEIKQERVNLLKKLEKLALINCKSHERKIIPFKNFSFVEKKSDVSKYKPRKKLIKILLGDSKGNFTDAIAEYIKMIMEDKYDLKFFCSSHGSKILEISSKETIDIYILITNNLICDHVANGGRLEDSLYLIQQIKKIYGKPVIALSGMDGPEYDSVNIKMQYFADFFFFIPPRLEMLGEAIEICLKIHPDFNQEP